MTTFDYFLDKEATGFLSIASPVFYDISNRYFTKFLGNPLNDPVPTLSGIIVVMLYYFSPYYIPVCCLLSLLLAGIVFLHGWPRRRSMASLIGWVVFTFLFNIVGLLVYLALNFTPVIKCHNCNKKRGLTTPKCPHCGAELSVAVPGRLSIITEA